jgi:hypothetical protein
LIGRAPFTPLDPIAHRAAVAHSEGQGQRPVFRETDTPSDDARPENVGRRRSLALDRSEHDGRLMAVRDGGAGTAVPSITAMLVTCTVIVVMTAPGSAEPQSCEPAMVTASKKDGSSDCSFAVAPPADPWAAHIAEAARRFDIPDRWIRAVMVVESVGDPAALSPKGAIGLMQVMPATWDELRAKHGLGDDPWQPCDNILAGTAYLREMHDRYGSVDAMLAAYNAGPGRYDEYLATGRALPAETVDYVAKIAPMIDGTVPVMHAAGSPSSPSWRLAPLFVARSEARDHDDHGVSPPSGQPSNDAPIVDLSALAPPSDGLFVQRPGREGELR